MNPAFCENLSRRMIVAIYLEGMTLVLPVHPVSRIERLTPQDKRQDRSKYGKHSFAAMLDAMMQAENPEDAPGFDALA